MLCPLYAQGHDFPLDTRNLVCGIVHDGTHTGRKLSAGVDTEKFLPLSAVVVPRGGARLGRSDRSDNPTPSPGRFSIPREKTGDSGTTFRARHHAAVESGFINVHIEMAVWLSNGVEYLTRQVQCTIGMSW